MSTIGLSNWAVDLKNVGALYPFQGYETPMVIACLAFYVIWQLWQIGHESLELADKSAQVDLVKSSSAIEKY